MPEETVVAPVETQEQPAAPSTEVQNPTESATEEENPEVESNGEGEEEQPKPVKGGFQKRIDRLTKEKEFWKQEALKGKPAAESVQTENTKEGNDPEPKAEDFATPEELIKALGAWGARQEWKKLDSTRQKQEAVAPLVKAQRDFAATVDDFHEVMADAADIPVSENMGVYLRDPEVGPQFAYYLAKNPEVAQSLVHLGPAALARQVATLESQFLKTSAAKPAVVSKAPPPPNATGKASATSTKDPGDMDPSEYRAWRAKTYPNL